jgi:hypothetical protein
MLTILLIILILVLVWGFRSLQSGQAEIACALRDLAQPPESAQEREERLLLWRAERDLMAPQQKTPEEQQQEAELWTRYEASLPPQSKATLKAGRLQVTPKRPECGQ